MKKFGILIALILISTLLASLYGVLHDQATYSISSEYFTVFKFDQFGFSDWGMNNPRATTALIGILATWWVGLFIGVVLGLTALMQKDYKLMFKYGINSILITIAVAILFGFIGYIMELLDPRAYANLNFPYIIKDEKSFMLVGSIHNYSYTGGEIGALAGIVYQVIIKNKTNKTASQK